MWRKPVQCRRVNLTAELTSASVYLIWESHCPCLKEKRMLRLSKTALAHALIILPWPSWASCASQSVYKEKRWSSKEGDPAKQVTLLVSSAVEWPLVARSCLQLSLVLLLKRSAINLEEPGVGEREEGNPSLSVFLLPITPRAPFGHASCVLSV